MNLHTCYLLYLKNLLPIHKYYFCFLIFAQRYTNNQKYKSRKIMNKLLQKSLFCFSKTIKWKQMRSFAELYFQRPSLPNKLIVVASQALTFNHLFTMNLMDSKDTQLPEGITPETTVFNFLMGEQKPLIVKTIHLGEQFELKNKACHEDITQIKHSTNRVDSIYQKAIKFIKNNEIQTSVNINDFLTRFYLKLQAQYYCKTLKIDQKSQMDNKKSDQIMAFLAHRNQKPEQTNYLDFLKEKMRISDKIANVQQDLKKIETKADRILNIYKWGSILVTTAHIVSFTYMIFFVEWLGWDIIEPITYSVTCIYLLLGLRFYKRYYRDRNAISVRDKLRQMVLKPSKIMQMQQHQQRLVAYQIELNKNKQKFKISAFRLGAYQTTMTDSL